MDLKKRPRSGRVSGTHSPSNHEGAFRGSTSLLSAPDDSLRRTFLAFADPRDTLRDRGVERLPALLHVVRDSKKLGICILAAIGQRSQLEPPDERTPVVRRGERGHERFAGG